jgi:glycosyltransferase involved in cell wall biosynthesis
MDRAFEDFSETNPYRVNLIHVNVDQVPEFYYQKGWDYFQHRYNIGVWFWELSRFPEGWLSRFQWYQEIWVASSFCAESLAKVSPIPVVKITYPIWLDEKAVRPDRARFGLHESSFVFLFVFDFLSIFERKNPLAVVEAFRKAFIPREDVVLVLKSINSQSDRRGMDLIGRATNGLNVKMIDAHLTSDEMYSLIGAADCYVSLHRSEGLGLVMAQSMYLGKPVIATAYSGNMEFMTVNNSFLVKYRLVELDNDFGPYHTGNVWADPDTDCAAEFMRLVYEKRELGAQIGQRASMDIRTHMSPFVAGKEIRDRLLRIAGG